MNSKNDDCNFDAEQLRQKDSAWSGVSVWQTMSLLSFPLVGPIVLYVYGAKNDLDELFIVFFNPVIYLLLGMTISTFNSWKLNRLKKVSEKLTKLSRTLHDLKISSLFFLTLFEGVISLCILADGAPITFLLVALIFYAAYAILGILWLRCLAAIDKIVKAV